jgi:hypothetical protein
MTFMPNRKLPKLGVPGANNPIGNAGGFNIGGNDGSAGELLANIGNRLAARSMANSNARAMLDIAKVEAVTQHHLTKMKLEAEAAAQQREHEAIIKTTRMNNTHELRKITATAEQARLNQLQSTNNVHGVLDRMVTDFPDADLNFETERNQKIEIKRPREASSDSAEGGS